MVDNLTKTGMNKTRACKAAGMPRRSLYYKAKKSAYLPEPSICKATINVCRERPLYGYRRVTAVLRRNGYRVNRKRVYKIMKHAGLLHKTPVHRPHWQVHKQSQIAELPDVYWQADMTKIYCGEDGWGYLFNVVDCCSRSWPGYCLSKFCSSDEALKSLQMALEARAPQAMRIVGLKLGTDGGPQYTSKKFEGAIKLLGMVHEVSRKHTPEDDGVIEAFHKTLKSEYVWPHEFSSFAQLERVIKEAHYDYNCKRIHSGLKYKTPNEYLEEVMGKGLTTFVVLKVVQK